MTRIVTFAAATLAAVTIAGAQTTTQPPSTQPPSSDRSAPQQPAAQLSQSDKQITVSGCLKEGASAGTFILADSSAAPTTATGREGQLGAVGMTGMTKTYNLSAKTGDDLSKHVNHKMEVTGTVSAQRADASTASGARQPSGETGQPGSGAGQQGTPAQPGATAKAGAAAQPTEIFNVQSFKMVAASCS